MKIADTRKIETTSLDYKQALETSKPKSWLKSVSAFANTSGGHILFGVTDDAHEAVGVEHPQEDVSKIAELIGSHISPVPRYKITEEDSKNPERKCIDLAVSSGPDYPYYYRQEQNREAFIRHGDRSEPASDYELNNLILKGGNKTYDSIPSNRSLSDVSFTLLSATYKEITGESFNTKKDLFSMRLIDESSQVTNAGLLLCDQGPLHQSKIICTRWKGNDKGAVDADALDDQEYSRVSIITQLKNAESFIRNNSRKAWTVRGMLREETSDYPYRAVREALVNAIIHRDYQIIGAEIHVDMFDNRLQIVSPGGMMNGNRIQDLDLRRVPSMRRNEIISDVFGRLHYMDRRGSGINRILTSYSAEQEYSGFVENPEFYSNEFMFSVMLPNRSAATPAQMSICNSENEKTQLSAEKTQLSAEKTQLSAEKTQLKELDSEKEEDDPEMKRFKERFLSGEQWSFRAKTRKKIIGLFQKYRYEYSFNRKSIAEKFEISENQASSIIRQCVQENIFRKEKKDIYYFRAFDTEHKK